MSSEFRSVCFSHDANLLETRRLLLAPRFNSFSVCDLQELASFANQGPVHLLVLCHTIPEKECMLAIKTVRATSPDVKVMTFASVFSPKSCHGDVVIGTLDGPAIFLRKADELVLHSAL